MRHFFTSDPHFSHGNIMKYCKRTLWMSPEERDLLAKQQKHLDSNGRVPRELDFRVDYQSIDRMNQGLLENINKTVGENDVLWCLGDWCFAQENKYYGVAKSFRDRIKCKTIHYIWGNHDNGSIGDIFTTNNELAMIAINPGNGAYWIGDDEIDSDRDAKYAQRIALCHYAMAIWNGSHKGNWHFYGHSHAGAEPWMEEHFPGRRSLDVGVDNAFKILGEYRPFSYEELANLMAKRAGFSMDHHR